MSVNDRTTETPKYACAASKTQFWKLFEDHGLFRGTIDGYDARRGLYHVTYDDGDEEELFEDEVTHWIKEDLKPEQTPIQKTVPPKYATGTKFWKHLGGHANPLEAVIESFDFEQRFYHIRYLYPPDGHGEGEAIMYEHEVTRCLNASLSIAPKTISSRKGRSITKVSYCDHEDEEEEEEDHSLDDNHQEPPPSKKRPTSIAKRPSAKKRRSKIDHDSHASDNNDILALTWEDLLGNVVKPKDRPKAPVQKGSFADYDTSPLHPELSLQEIKATKEYLDPMGMEAADQIVDRLIGEQVTKIGGLLGRALRDKQTLGSIDNPLALGTACTGTDAPALALTMVQEQMKLRLTKFVPREHMAMDDTVTMKDENANDKGGSSDDRIAILNYSHKYSCENDPFKQAYIARNFDSIVYPDIAKLCENAPRDMYQQAQPLPKANMFVAGTSCQNFAMSRATKHLDVCDRAQSEETFLAAVEIILQEQPQACVLENGTAAPWQKMADYICGRIKLSDCDSKNAIGNGDSKDDSNFETDPKDVTFSFSLEASKIVVEAVPSFIGVQCGATVAGYLKGSQGKIHPIEWPNNMPKTGNCTLIQLLKANKINKKSDTLVFDRPVTYCCHWINVDAKEYGLPQTRPRTYMFAWQPLQKPPDGHFYPDDLGSYWEALMQYLESNSKHSMETFTLQLDHDAIRTFREAIPDFSSTNTSDENLPHDNAAGMPSGINDEKRSMTDGGAHGKKKVPPHYWLDYLNCKSQRYLEVIENLHAQAARDAETHDSNYASYCWNISEHMTRENKRSASPGIVGCGTPGGDFWLPHQGRPLLGCEKLLVQGVPYCRMRLGNQTEVNLSDLAGNAMSSTVVCAAMLAAIVAPQLRKEMKPSTGAEDDEGEKPLKKQKPSDSDGQANLAIIKKYLLGHAQAEGGGTEHERKWTGEICNGAPVERNQSDNTSMAFFAELATLSHLALKSSIWCTCESSGSRSRTHKFLQCQVCRVSCCRNCVDCHSGYTLETHDTTEIEIGNEGGGDFTEDERHVGAFETKLRSILPLSLYLGKEGIDKIADVEGDRFRIRGLDKFNFGLHRIKRDRAKWLVIYYARDNNGVGEAVAELRMTVGETMRAQCDPNALGLLCELTSFMPARSEPVQYGKLPPCCHLFIPCPTNRSAPTIDDAFWQVRRQEARFTITLSGHGYTDSHRKEVGLTEEAASALEDNAKDKANTKHYEAAITRKEERRWCYPKNWEKWPQSIRIRCFEKIDNRVPGKYHRASCRQTTNQSALWIKQVEGKPSVYLLLRPNFSRTGGDSAIISTSIDHNDTRCILAELDQYWQPCDSFDVVHQLQAVVCPSWVELPGFECKVPESKMQAELSTCPT